MLPCDGFALETLHQASLLILRQEPLASAPPNAGVAVLPVIAALRLPAAGCRALLRSGFGATLPATLAALLAAPRHLYQPVERVMGNVDLLHAGPTRPGHQRRPCRQ